MAGAKAAVVATVATAIPTVSVSNSVLDLIYQFIYFYSCVCVACLIYSWQASECCHGLEPTLIPLLRHLSSLPVHN